MSVDVEKLKKREVDALANIRLKKNLKRAKIAFNTIRATNAWIYATKNRLSLQPANAPKSEKK